MSQQRSSIAFVSTMSGSPWGGSEELWAQTALRLLSKQVPVAISVCGWRPPPAQVLNLFHSGAKIQQRFEDHPIIARAWRKASSRGRAPMIMDVDRFLRSVEPGLVVLSTGGVVPQPSLMELCANRGWPFITLGHTFHEAWWPNDVVAARLNTSLQAAQACYFVSKASWLLVEERLNCRLPNAEIVRNPFNVGFDASPPWKRLTSEGELALACVGRLDPVTKGQDLLLEALRHEPWRMRPWHLTFYGDGPHRTGLTALCERFGLSNRITFAGHMDSVETIWTANQVLVMPSRQEGMPLAIVEAMLCGRPVVATDVGGVSEIVEDGLTGFLAPVPTTEAIQSSLDEMWKRRSALEEMGQYGAKRIREIMPADPAEEFSKRLIEDLKRANPKQHACVSLAFEDQATS